MAGLAGIVSLKGPLDAADAVALVETMGRVQEHRGRGGWRVLAHPGLVHVVPRDDSNPGADPGASARDDGTACGPFLAFDGDIINRGEVRAELTRAGIALRSGTDRELVLRAWERWGEGSAEHLDGRFAFLVHDPVRGASFLVRDRFGHKPLHYTIRGDRLYFASEVKTLLAVTAPPVLHELALMEWSLYGDVLPPRTLFRGIQAVARGHLVEVSAEGRTQAARAYYDTANVVDPALHAEYAGRSTSELLTILESAVDRAVLSHMDGQRDVGIMLSGGVDSSVIAALAARHGKIRAYNFSVTGDPRLDERATAEAVARKLGLPFENIAIDGEGYRRELARTTYLYEMPLWHMQGVPTHLLARRAHKDGIRILLTGTSVGPLLGAASDRYRWILPPPVLGRVPSDVFGVVRKAVYAASGLPVATPFFTRMVGGGLQLADGGARFGLITRYNDTYSFLRDRRERRIHVMRLSDNALFLPRFYHQGDRLCMAESIEYCDASVEAGFVALALNLPTTVIFRKKMSKWILKELATRYIPREIAFQKKLPLDVPVEQYFAPLFRAALFRDGFLASFLGLDWNVAQALVAKARESTPLVFQLANIETWGRLFFMNQSVEEVTNLVTR